ncbi:MAG TPA: hypothetical protein DCQ31_04005, partial [Bacteroidales bacterium]|nr:hypothetical protein [Bacteroidales bacterium]
DEVKVYASDGELGADILTMEVTNQIDTAIFSGNEITVKVAAGTNLAAVKLDFTLSKGARSEPLTGSVVTVSADTPFAISVFPQNTNASSKLWFLKVIPGQFSKEAQILTFAVPNQTKPAIFDKNSRTIEVEVPFGTDLSSIVPEYTLSVGATLAEPDPTKPMQFTDRRAVVFSVKPQDPALPSVKWFVTISIQDYLAEILSFGFKDITTKVNIIPSAKTIAVEVPFKTDISKLTPLYTISAGASSSWPSDTERAFQNNVAESLVITAHNGKIKTTWTITVIIAENAFFNQDFDLTGNFLPSGWNSDTLNAKATWQQANQLRNPFSKITPISKFSALCPWLETEQDEWLISPWIDASSALSIYLKFYAGFSRNWLDNANLACYVKAENEDFKEVWNAKTDTSKTVQWEWRQVIVNISNYKGKKIQLAWQYKGKNGDLVGLDQVLLADIGLPNNEMEENSKPELSAYPNPASDYLTIESEYTGDVDIWCINGRKVATVKTNETIYIGELPTGIYIIQSANPNSLFKKTMFTKK